MKTSRTLGIFVAAAACAGAVTLPAALPQQASAKAVTANGNYTIISPLVTSHSDTVRSVKLTKKKLTVKGAVLKGNKRMKGSSFTFRISPKVWIGEYEWDNPPYKKYAGKKRTDAIKKWNKRQFISLTMKVKGGKIIRIASHA